MTIKYDWYITITLLKCYLISCCVEQGNTFTKNRKAQSTVYYIIDLFIEI